MSLRPDEQIQLLDEVWAERSSESHISSLTQAVERNLDHLKTYMAWATPDACNPQVHLERVKLLNAGWDYEGQTVFNSEYGFDFTFVDRSSNEVVGCGGLLTRTGFPRLEIGVWVARSHLRRGIARAFGRAMMAQAFRFPEVGAVVWKCDDENTASSKVAQALMFEFEGIDTNPAPGKAIVSGREQVWIMTRERYQSLA